MARVACPSLFRRGQAALTLLIPALAGLAFLALGGAPSRYVLVNAGALVLAIALALLARRPAKPSMRRALAFALTCLFPIPLVIGPEIDGIARWLSFGGLSLHVGYLVIPAIAVLAAEDPDHLPLSIVLAMLIASRQPDLASALALLFGALGGVIALRNRWWISCVRGRACRSIWGQSRPQPPTATLCRKCASGRLADLARFRAHHGAQSFREYRAGNPHTRRSGSAAICPRRNADRVRPRSACRQLPLSFYRLRRGFVTRVWSGAWISENASDYRIPILGGIGQDLHRCAVSHMASAFNCASRSPKNASPSYHANPRRMAHLAGLAGWNTHRLVVGYRPVHDCEAD